VEIWGWRKREGIDRVEERYIRCVLGIDARSPGYMAREELQREKMKSSVGRRAF